MPTNLTKMHIALNTSNFAESVAFYERFLGRKPVKKRVGYAKFDVDVPRLNLTLNEVSSAVPGVLSHLGVQVDSSEAVVAAQRQLEFRGVAIDRVEMGTECCHAVQDKFWVRDPEGTAWEFFYVQIGDTRPDLEQDAPTAQASGAVGCCGSRLQTSAAGGAMGETQDSDGPCC